MLTKHTLYDISKSANNLLGILSYGCLVSSVFFVYTM